MIIGLVGRSRVGKDTIAAALVHQGYTLRRLAQPVKDACVALYGWPIETLETDAKEVMDSRWGISPRRAMVHMTHVMRMHMGNDFFTRRFFDDVQPGTHIVIPDVRYAHDVEEIHRRGGITIRVIRELGPAYDFESHIDTLKTTYVLNNDGTTDELVQKAVACIRNSYVSKV
jgi:hypothetical protein